MVNCDFEFLCSHSSLTADSARFVRPEEHKQDGWREGFRDTARSGGLHAVTADSVLPGQARVGYLSILVTSLKMLQSGWLLKCTDIEVLRRYFLTLGTQQSKRRNVNNGLCIIVINGESTHIRP